MRHYFFQTHDQRGTHNDPCGIAMSGPGAAMLHAVAICAEIGCSDDFRLGFAVSVRDELGAAIGRVSVVVTADAAERRDA